MLFKFELNCYISLYCKVKLNSAITFLYVIHSFILLTHFTKCHTIVLCDIFRVRRHSYEMVGRVSKMTPDLVVLHGFFPIPKINKFWLVNFWKNIIDYYFYLKHIQRVTNARLVLTLANGILTKHIFAFAKKTDMRKLTVTKSSNSYFLSSSCYVSNVHLLVMM